MVLYEDNLYSVPDGVGRVSVAVHARAFDLSIFTDRHEVARHERLTGKGERLLDPSHRKAWPSTEGDELENVEMA